MLVNGVELCTHSKAYQFECEIRYAMSLPDKATKRQISKVMYLNKIEDERGNDERMKLRAEMLRRYKK